MDDDGNDARREVDGDDSASEGERATDTRRRGRPGTTGHGGGRRMRDDLNNSVHCI